jgi:hypothetical protein
VPVWHDATRTWVKEGKLALLGVVQEQHPERARLFAQWKELDWPILHDPVNRLGCRAVPIPIAIDEHGIVRAVRPSRKAFRETFINRDFPAPATTEPAGTAQAPDLGRLRRKTTAQDTAENWRMLGDGLVVWGGPEDATDTITAYQRSLEADAGHGPTLFRLGVAFRRRAESEHAKSGDFQAAVRSWQRALDTNPNQYIWRRRIQQYGPRLDKPYPFYDWVSAARRDIRARGEPPVPLAVEPSGAEIAHPTKQFTAQKTPQKPPDPDGKIHRDKERLVHVESAVVPPAVRPGHSARVHLVFRPDAEHETTWDNTAGQLRLWVDAPEGWEIDRQLLLAPPGERPETQETRRLEFEVQVPASAREAARLSAYALYYVCEGRGGRCVYRRQDISIEVPVEPTAP